MNRNPLVIHVARLVVSSEIHLAGPMNLNQMVLPLVVGESFWQSFVVPGVRKAGLKRSLAHK